MNGQPGDYSPSAEETRRGTEFQEADGEPPEELSEQGMRPMTWFMHRAVLLPRSIFYDRHFTIVALVHDILLAGQNDEQRSQFCLTARSCTAVPALAGVLRRQIVEGDVARREPIRPRSTLAGATRSATQVCG
jgi:hypothetical protein